MPGIFDYYIEKREMTQPMFWFYATGGTKKQMPAGHYITLLPWDCMSEGEINAVADNLIKHINQARKDGIKAYKKARQTHRDERQARCDKARLRNG